MAQTNSISTFREGGGPGFINLLLFIILSIIIGTALRVSLLVIYPFLALFIVYFFQFRITPSLLALFLLVFLSFVLSLSTPLFLRYKLLSLYYMLPFLLLLFTDPQAAKKDNGQTIRLFMYCLAAVAVVNDLIGFVQIFMNPKSDDSFLGLYSQYSLSLNGLVLINSILFFYYFVRFLYLRKLTTLLVSLFFLICSLLGFYGAGLVVFAIAFILAFFKFSVKALIKTVSAGLLSIIIIYFAMLWIKPLVLEYNISNIKKMASFDIHNGPRKPISFYNYAVAYPRNAKDFLFGSGPGTFNSRSAFMVGSPSYFSGVSFLKDDEQPYYFKNYAYSLWNEKNTIQALYLDGFRNQPFSSVLAFLGEYGLVFTLVFALLYYHYYRKIVALYRRGQGIKEAESYFRFFKFLIILLPLLLLIDNYFEYPEVMILFTLGIKFSHARLLSLTQNGPAYES